MGKGYAIEPALAYLNFGFKELKIDKIWGFVDSKHRTSQIVFKKAGMLIKGEFEYDKLPHYFYQIKRKDWLKDNT